MRAEENESAIEYGDGVWRDGRLLVVDDGATLPKRCPKCNAPDVVGPLKLKHARRGGHGVVGALVTEIAYAGSDYAGPVCMYVHFCRKHRRLRIWFLLISFALMVFGAGGALACWIIDPRNGMSGAFFLPGAVAMGGFAGLLVSINGENPWFHPKGFNGRRVWLRGACTNFLESLPPLR